MNMEDRLREAFDQEAQHLHAPSGSPENAVRRGRHRRASNLIGGAVLVLALIGGTAAGLQLLGDSEEPQQDLIAASEINQSDGPTSEAVSAAGVAEFDWERISLPKPDGATVWNIQVAAVDDGFIAVGNGFVNDGAGSEQTFTWSSRDGADWVLTSTKSPFGQSVDVQLLTMNDGFVAVARSFDDRSQPIRLYSSQDGANWSEGEADFGALSQNQYLWFAGAASGDGTTVLAGTIQEEPSEPPIVLDQFGVVLEEQDFDGSFAVKSLGSGELITEVPLETVYGGPSEGLTVYDNNGEIVVVVPWGALDEASDGGVVELEQDGVLLSIDYSEGTFVATDGSTGTVVASGSLDDLYGPLQRVLITHPDTGDVIVDMTLDEFYDARDESSVGYQDNRPKSELVVLATTDGRTWDRVEPGNDVGEEGRVSSLGYGPEGFVFVYDSFGAETYSQSLWRSTNGRSWEQVGSVDEPNQGPIVGGDDAYFSFRYGRRAGVARSTDGVNWTTVYETDDAGSYFNTLAAGEMGVVAIGQHDEGSVAPQLTISKDGRTMDFDYELGLVTVTEDASGDVLTTIDFDVFELDPPDQFQIDEDTGTVTITDTDGTVLMVITEAEAEASSQETEYVEDYSIPTPALAFSPDGTEWFTVTTSGLEVAWAQGAAVGKDAIVIVGESAGDYAAYGSSGETTVVLSDGSTAGFATATTLAVPGDFAPEAQQTYVWVGRRR